MSCKIILLQNVKNFTLRQVGVLSKGVFVTDAAAAKAEAIEGETLNML